MTSFSFRQRAGDIDWRAITSVKAEEIVLKGDAKPLQYVLDAVTFCEFRPEDVKTNSIESVSKLVNILQLISEYLLHCQEAQFKAMRELQSKYTLSRENAQKMKKEILSLKEDRKIYQRQLALLRKSLGPDHFAQKDLTAMSLAPPKIHNLLEITKPAEVIAQSSRPIDADMFQSILKHEEDTRTFMAALLNDQRNTFMEQIGMLSSALGQSKENSSSSLSSQNMTDRLVFQMESTVQKAVESMQRTMADSLKALAEEQRKSAALNAQKILDLEQHSTAKITKDMSSSTSSPPTVHHISAAEALRTAALEEFEHELNAREAALDRREKEIAECATAARQSLEMTMVARRASDTERLDLLTANESLALNALTVGARVICSTVRHALLRKKLKSFRHWCAIVQNMRDIEQSNEQARLLVYAKEQRTQREHELQTQLEMEVEKAAVAQAKQNNLLRALDAAESKVKELSEANEGPAGSARHVAELQKQLQQEKEKVIILTAKFNTLKAKSEKDAQDISTTKPSRDSSVMTSMEITSPISRPQLHLRQSVQGRYLTSEDSEYDLFDRVSRRLAGRKTQEEIEEEAMATLAAEIQQRIASRNE